MKLTEHPFILSITTARREAILHEVELLHMDAGDLIFDEGSAPDALFLTLEGSVNFFKWRPDGSKHIISESAEGGFFGEVGVFTGEHRALAAEAGSKALIGKVPETTVKKIIEDAEPVRKILESVIEHLNNTTRHYVEDVMKTQKLSLVGTMVSSILHDFKNPFSIISLGAHVIRQRHKDDPRTEKICENIEAQIRRMVDMANDLAAFSRGDDEIEIAYVSIELLFKMFRELNTPFFKEEDITIELIDNGLSLMGDTTKLLRVLQNLVSNAMEAIHNSGKTGKLTVEAYEAGEHIRLTVSDNGPGIPEEIRDTLFEPFVTHGKNEGTGLGTAIVKSIVDAHKGKISFDTGPEGTTFTILLPKER
ncbi:sensor histidine kinase [Coraliomargarita parva]|uniref:sensor histidine kinase n=1 Tax=Coraliomargarita parva TaxID=3014050 RepID=UPI0022B559F6|nr:ATP-binding protein [Coraliomargarita parva]